MHRELQEADQAQNCYEHCVRLRRQDSDGEANFKTQKMYLRLAYNMMKERCNDHKLKRAARYMQMSEEILVQILEFSDLEGGSRFSSNIFLIKHYRMLCEMYSRNLDCD